MENTNSFDTPWVSVDDLAAIRIRAKELVDKHHIASFAPFVQKIPPTFTAGQVAELCGIERSAFEYRRTKHDLPDGTEAENRRRLFTVKEAFAWVSAYKASNTRNGFHSGQIKPSAAVITVGSMTRGTGKSTTAVNMAQGLSLRGHRVLLVDTDPQGSLTSMLGVDLQNVDDEDTVLDFIAGRADSLADAIMPTYWSGIHLISSSPRIPEAEEYLRQMEKNGQPYWDSISRGLDESVRSQYDAIIIDVQATYSSLLVSSFFAADILIFPVPVTPIGFASSLVNFNFLNALNEDYISSTGINKGYNFTNILPFRFDGNVESSQVREWLVEAYGKHVLPIDIPTISSRDTDFLKLGTVYDAIYSQQSSSQVKAFRNAFDAYQRLAQAIEGQMQRVWQAQVCSR